MNELGRAISGPFAKRMVLFLGEKLDDESWKIKQSFRQPSNSVSESFRFNASEQERRRAFQK
ncbi:hypothetical protein [Paenibacillus antibioticophila]|uniref:hypothetical protein n=1 Tax=Paenibacillus antibioticophila TaxID=1274374 RepID=UPI0011DD77CA|nr:hypothetical protein [Paenibacillus antibioticophila]